MTNYNDGNWHGWNGGGCPVHLRSLVEGMYLRDGEPASESPVTDDASDFDWLYDGKNRLIAFRVIKEHKEPLEFWVSYADEKVMIYSPEHDPIEYADFGFIHVREVIE